MIYRHQTHDETEEREEAMKNDAAKEIYCVRCTALYFVSSGNLRSTLKTISHNYMQARYKKKIPNSIQLIIQQSVEQKSEANRFQRLRRDNGRD